MEVMGLLPSILRADKYLKLSSNIRSEDTEPFGQKKMEEHFSFFSSSCGKD